jgi:hypothetical protein
MFNWIWCAVVGHRTGWIPARVPNPYAIRSSVWGCTRCNRSLDARKYPVDA